MIMTATIFTILKVAGLILLALVLLLLTVVVLVLAVPVRYHVAGTFYGKPEGKAVVSWLCHLLSCQVSYRKELEILVRVLGIPVWIVGGKKRKPALEGPEEDEIREEVLTDGETGKDMAAAEGKSGKDEAPAEGKSGKDAVSAEGKSGKDGVSADGKIQDGGQGTASGSQEADPGKAPDEPDGKGEDGDSRPDQGKKTSGLFRGRKKKKKPGFSFSAFCDKLKKKAEDLCKKAGNVQEKFRELVEKKDRLAAFLRDKGNQKAFLLVKDCLIDILKHIFPKKCKGRFRFGFDDPYDTGRILTYAAPFYGLYGGKVELIPVFEEKVMEGELEARGRIRLGYLVFVGIRILANRNFRILLRRIRRK